MKCPNKPKFDEYRSRDESRERCPYPDCGYEGTECQVDDHRVYAHSDEPQAGSNHRCR